MYNLEFQLLHIPEHFHLPISADSLGTGADQERTTVATISFNALTYAGVGAIRPPTKLIK
jgi:hypothetical protein